MDGIDERIAVAVNPTDYGSEEQFFQAIVDQSPASSSPPPPDRWQWTAWYDDGSVLREADDHGFAEVQQSRIVRVTCDPTPTSSLPGYGVVIERSPDESAPVAFFRRRYTPWAIAGGDWTTVHCLGLEWPDGHAYYTFWDELGHVVVSNGRDII